MNNCAKIDETPALPVAALERASQVLESAMSREYLEYLFRRMDFLLSRFRRFPAFPGVPTGYSSITGEEFRAEDIFSYSWINGRGTCVLTRFSRIFDSLREDLIRCAESVIKTMERHYHLNNAHFPFIVTLEGLEKSTGISRSKGYKSYSDLNCCQGFLEYGFYRKDERRLSFAKSLFAEIFNAILDDRFITEPIPTPSDRQIENPRSIALDILNEFIKKTGEHKYLEMGVVVAEHLLRYHYLPDRDVFVEYVTLDGNPFLDEEGRLIVDPGHAIEFFGFALEFSRLCKIHNYQTPLVGCIDKIAPEMILRNIHMGWNPVHGGMYKTVDAISGQPANDTMPWWILPETLHALILAYELTGGSVFLDQYRRIHNLYFARYLNPQTGFGPFQNFDGKTGVAIDIPPACKFQDPEFHSGKNLLAITQVINRINAGQRHNDFQNE